MTVSSDGQHLAVGGTKGPIDVWDLAINQVQATLLGHESSVHALLFSPNPSVLVSGSGDHTVRFWDTGGKVPSDVKDLDSTVRTLAFSDRDVLLATAGDDRVVTLFSMDTWKKQSTLQGHPLAVRSVAFCPDQQLWPR